MARSPSGGELRLHGALLFRAAAAREDVHAAAGPAARQHEPAGFSAGDPAADVFPTADRRGDLPHRQYRQPVRLPLVAGVHVEGSLGSRRCRCASRLGADGIDGVAESVDMDSLAAPSLGLVVLAAGALADGRDRLRRGAEPQTVSRRVPALAARDPAMARGRRRGRERSGDICHGARRSTAST